MEKIIFSLIVATYGRLNEIDYFLRSIRKQKYDLGKVEVLIVEQNDAINLVPVIAKYQKYLKIIHIKTKIKGTSHSRNLGLKKAQGDIIAFPDDDCAYYPDTLQTVVNIFKENPNIQCLSGRIYDRQRGKNILREWGEKAFFVNWKNFYYNSSAITKFLRKNTACSHLFCEQLGPATEFGSCEDPDYIVGLLNDQCKILYSPDIEVWHPNETIHQLSEEKIYRYGMGFGGFCKKNLNFYIFLLFIMVITYHSWHYLIEERSLKKKRLIYIKSRLRGWSCWAAMDHRKRCNINESKT